MLRPSWQSASCKGMKQHTTNDRKHAAHKIRLAANNKQQATAASWTWTWTWTRTTTTTTTTATAKHGKTWQNTRLGSQLVTNRGILRSVIWQAVSLLALNGLLGSSRKGNQQWTVIRLRDHPSPLQRPSKQKLKKARGMAFMLFCRKHVVFWTRKITKG